jgi:hypothetical protein
MLSSSSLRKNKEVLSRNGGGKNWERNVAKPVLCGRVTFEHDTLSFALCLGWEIHLSPDHTPYKITNWSVIPVVESVFPRQLSCRQYVQREVQPKNPSIASAISTVLKSFYCIGHPQVSSESLVTLIYFKSCYLFRVIDVGYIKVLL